MKKMISIMLLAMMIVAVVVIPNTASAETSYTINGVTVTAGMIAHSDTGCNAEVGETGHTCNLGFVKSIYAKVWKTSYNLSSGLMQGVAAKDRTMTEHNLNRFFSQAKPGAILIISSVDQYYNTTATNSHYLMFLSGGNGGATFYEGDGLGHARITYWSWSSLISAWPEYGYIDAIFWPNAPEYKKELEVEGYRTLFSSIYEIFREIGNSSSGWYSGTTVEYTYPDKDSFVVSETEKSCIATSIGVDTEGNIWLKTNDRTFMLFYDAASGVQLMEFTGSGSSIVEISGVAKPTGNKTSGKSFTLLGKIEADVPIYKVVARVVDRSTGKNALPAVTLYPNDTSLRTFNINETVNGTNISSSLKFETLPQGLYTYKLSAQLGFEYGGTFYPFGDEQKLIQSTFTVDNAGGIPGGYKTLLVFGSTSSVYPRYGKARSVYFNPFIDAWKAYAYTTTGGLIVSKLVVNTYGEVWAEIGGNGLEGYYVLFYDPESGENDVDLYLSAKNVKVSDVNKPEGTLKAGKWFEFTGKLKADAPIYKVIVRVTDKSTGEDVLTPVTVMPNSLTTREIDLTTEVNGTVISDSLPIETLSEGTYNYSVTVQLGFEYQGEKFLEDDLFTVIESDFAVTGVAPTATPTAEPTATPTAEPTATPTAEPTATPTAEPTTEPSTELGNLSITAPSSVNVAGDTVTLPLSLNNPENIDLGSIEVHYNLPTGVAITGVTLNGGASGAMLLNNNPTAIVATISNISGSGKIIEVTLTVDSTASFPASMEVIPYVATPDGNSMIKLTSLNVTLKKGLKGDVNDDGVVNMIDIMKMANYVYVNKSLAINTSNADMNDDGVINMIDIMKVARVVYPN